MPEWLFLPSTKYQIKPAKNTPNGLVDQSPYNIFREKQAAVLYGLMNDNKLLRLLEGEFLNQNEGHKKKIMTVGEVFSTLRTTIFENSRWSRTLSISERMTQKNYVDALIIDVNKIYEKTEGKSVHMPMICDYAYHKLSDEGLDDQHLDLYFNGMKRLSEVGSAKRAELLKVRDIILKARGSGDTATKNHYEDLLIRLNHALYKN